MTIAMETPKGKLNKLSMNLRASTPKKESNPQIMDNDYSPLFMSCTQDCIDSVDVVWDWNSPQTKVQSDVENKPLKRLNGLKSKKDSVPESTQNNIESFGKLKEQLERLRNQLVQDKAEKLTAESNINRLKSPRRSMQAKPRNLLTKSFSSESLGGSFFDDCDFDTSKISKPDNSVFKLDDSLDLALEEFQEEDYELLSQAIPLTTPVSMVTSKETVQHGDKTTRIVERSSDVAVATQECSGSSSITKQCSPEEIEKKRRIALSKLEERRIEDIIEKKRQQAIMRLENNRRKKAQNTTVAIKRYNSS